MLRLRSVTAGSASDGHKYSRLAVFLHPTPWYRPPNPPQIQSSKPLNSPSIQIISQPPHPSPTPLLTRVPLAQIKALRANPEDPLCPFAPPPIDQVAAAIAKEKPDGHALPPEHYFISIATLLAS
jgi:hypothetical protein